MYPELDTPAYRDIRERQDRGAYQQPDPFKHQSVMSKILKPLISGAAAAVSTVVGLGSGGSVAYAHPNDIITTDAQAVPMIIQEAGRWGVPLRSYTGPSFSLRDPVTGNYVSVRPDIEILTRPGSYIEFGGNEDLRDNFGDIEVRTFQGLWSPPTRIIYPGDENIIRSQTRDTLRKLGLVPPLQPQVIIVQPQPSIVYVQPQPQVVFVQPQPQVVYVYPQFPPPQVFIPQPPVYRPPPRHWPPHNRPFSGHWQPINPPAFHHWH